MIDLDEDNVEFYTGFQLVNETRNSVFLTGKAGTGKTTFLHYLLSKTRKKRLLLLLQVSQRLMLVGKLFIHFLKLSQAYIRQTTND